MFNVVCCVQACCPSLDALGSSFSLPCVILGFGGVWGRGFCDFVVLQFTHTHKKKREKNTAEFPCYEVSFSFLSNAGVLFITDMVRAQAEEQRRLERQAVSL